MTVCLLKPVDFKPPIRAASAAFHGIFSAAGAHLRFLSVGFFLLPGQCGSACSIFAYLAGDACLGELLFRVFGTIGAVGIDRALVPNANRIAFTGTPLVNERHGGKKTTTLLSLKTLSATENTEITE
ncbi:MAG: hypothetical protein HZC43_03580 [Nitrosomonadales bacterium]|nr:hypothetical protein [Nitrosomonadales bacterium]